MTATRRVARTQSQLRIVVVISALLWTAAVLLGVLAIELLVGNWTHGRIARGWDWNVALAIALLAGCLVLWRARFVLSKRHVALWMEEHVPSLQYALVTASDPLVTGDMSLLEIAIDRSNIDTFVRPAVLTPVIYAGVALSVMAGAFAAALTLASSRASTVTHDVRGGVGVNTPMPTRLPGLTALIGRGGDWQVMFPMPSVATTISLSEKLRASLSLSRLCLTEGAILSVGSYTMSRFVFCTGQYDSGGGITIASTSR